MSLFIFSIQFDFLLVTLFSLTCYGGCQFYSKQATVVTFSSLSLTDDDFVSQYKYDIWVTLFWLHMQLYYIYYHN